MDDREIIQWDKRLADQVKRSWENYKHLHIDLSTARIDQSYLIAGEFLYVEESSGSDALAKIKLNRNSNDSLDLEKGVKVETVFIEVHITNDALEGEWLDLVFGINFKYYREMELVVVPAAADIKSKYGTSNQAITITLTGLVDDAVRASLAIDNSANLFLDALVQLLINTGNVGAPAGDMNCIVYAYGTANGGATYSGGATGADAAFGAVAGQLITNCPILGYVNVDAQNETFESDVFSVASAFGGVLPQKWGIIVVNQVGQTLGASSAFYQGVMVQTP